jgi:hypothetical protein
MIHGMDPQQKHRTNKCGEPEQQETALEKKSGGHGIQEQNISQIYVWLSNALTSIRQAPDDEVRLKKMLMGMQCM